MFFPLLKKIGEGISWICSKVVEKVKDACLWMKSKFSDVVLEAGEALSSLKAQTTVVVNKGVKVCSWLKSQAVNTVARAVAWIVSQFLRLWMGKSGAEDLLNYYYELLEAVKHKPIRLFQVAREAYKVYNANPNMTLLLIVIHLIGNYCPATTENKKEDEEIKSGSSWTSSSTYLPLPITITSGCSIITLGFFFMGLACSFGGYCLRTL